jgi:hypothetical protein
VSLSGLQKASSSVANGSDVSDLELLAHYELVDEQTGRERSGFAVLLELTHRRLTLEGDVALSPGDTLKMNFFLPDSGSDEGRLKVSLSCMVAQRRDNDQLHYSARISKIGESSRRAIEKLHAERRSGSRS